MKCSMAVVDRTGIFLVAWWMGYCDLDKGFVSF